MEPTSLAGPSSLADSNDLDVDWGALGGASNEAGTSVDLGNWLLEWVNGMRAALLHFRALDSRPRVFNFSHHVLAPHSFARLQPRTRAFLHCLPGVGQPLHMAGLPAALRHELLHRAPHRGPWERQLCCTSAQNVDELVAMRPLLSWALQQAFGTCGVRVRRAPAVLHLRCGDAPFSRHGTYHLLKHSGVREMVARLRDARGGGAGRRRRLSLRVVSCRRHQQPNNWERGVERGMCGAQPEALRRSCRAYREEVLALLRAEGIAASAHECELDMARARARARLPQASPPSRRLASASPWRFLAPRLLASTAHAYLGLASPSARRSDARAPISPRSPQVQDFALLWHAPALLAATTSSFAFLAGMYGRAGNRGAFHMAPRVREVRSACGNCPGCRGRDHATPQAAPERCGACERQAGAWMVPARHVLLHSEVADYLNMSDVIARLRAPPTQWPTTPTRLATLQRRQQRLLQKDSLSR